MKRRSFIRNISASSLGAFALANIPVRVFAKNNALFRAAAAGDNDNVLIFIQLHGGNDALNTLVPIDRYSDYFYHRANIALPDSGPRAILNVDDSIPVSDQVGLHPDMEDFRTLYREGKAVIVQNVGYPDMNMSHFRGRDLVFMGLDGNDDDLNVSSGWMGRFLNHEYPDYPEEYPTDEMEDPIALELGSDLSLAFHRENGIPIGLNIPNPEGFFDFINNAGIASDQLYPVEGHAGIELEYLWQFKEMTNIYAERLQEVYAAGTNSSVEYPEEYTGPAPPNFVHNPLSGQLRIIARLLSGGIKTRIFLCRIGGFDTHGNQVDQTDHTLGAHAALLYHLSSAIKAFQDDLAQLGQEDRVLTMTFTEFGRRVYSNASYGTDHGTSTPVFLFGKALHGKIHGTNPDLNDLDGGNMKYNIDYRQIYTSVVQDWFGADDEAMQETGFDEWVGQKLDLFGLVSTDDIHLQKNTKSIVLYPNPAKNQVSVKFYNPKQTETTIVIYDVYGKKIMERKLGLLTYGYHEISLQIYDLKRGNYICRVITQNSERTEQLVVY